MNDILAKSKPFQSVICYTNVNSTRALKCGQKVQAFGSVLVDLIRLKCLISMVCRSEYAGKGNKF